MSEKVLVALRSWYGDEFAFDAYGVMERGEFDEAMTTLQMMPDEFWDGGFFGEGFSFGTNEYVKFDNFQSFKETVTVTEISDADIEVLKRVFPAYLPEIRSDHWNLWNNIFAAVNDFVEENEEDREEIYSFDDEDYVRVGQNRLNGGWLRDTVTVSPKRLVELFGNPDSNLGESKVSGSYVFADKNWNIFEVYDWKETSLYDSSAPSPKEFWKLEEEIVFSVGGDAPENEVPNFVAWLRSRF